MIIYMDINGECLDTDLNKKLEYIVYANDIILHIITNKSILLCKYLYVNT